MKVLSLQLSFKMYNISRVHMYFLSFPYPVTLTHYTCWRSAIQTAMSVSDNLHTMINISMNILHHHVLNRWTLYVAKTVFRQVLWFHLIFIHSVLCICKLLQHRMYCSCTCTMLLVTCSWYYLLWSIPVLR